MNRMKRDMLGTCIFNALFLPVYAPICSLFCSWSCDSLHCSLSNILRFVRTLDHRPLRPKSWKANLNTVTKKHIKITIILQLEIFQYNYCGNKVRYHAYETYRSLFPALLSASSRRHTWHHWPNVGQCLTLFRAFRQCCLCLFMQCGCWSPICGDALYSQLLFFKLKI